MAARDSQKPRLLEGKRILVTGGSRGLGRAMCAAFAREGARVAFTWLKNQVEAESAAAEFSTPDAPAQHRQLSVLDSAGMTRWIGELEKIWGGLDVLVNNAGVSQNLPIALIEEEDWDFVMDTNLKGTFLTTRAVLRGMIRRRSGVILNIGSLAGARMIESPIHYYTSKAAIKGFTEVLSKEVARYNVRVLCLAPGLLEGGVGQNLPEHKLTDYLKHCALGRVGTFDEVARLAAFAISDLNTYMNGETILIDGGV